MLIKEQHLKTIEQQLALVKSFSELSELDPQLAGLLEKHFTLYVGPISAGLLLWSG